MSESSGFREWGRSQGDPVSELPEEKLQLLGEVFTVLLREAARVIYERVLGDDERTLQLVGTVIFKFERFKGDEKPFMAVASIPDNPIMAKNLLESAADALREVRQEHGSE